MAALFGLTGVALQAAPAYANSTGGTIDYGTENGDGTSTEFKNDGSGFAVACEESQLTGEWLENKDYYIAPFPGCASAKQKFAKKNPNTVVPPIFYKVPGYRWTPTIVECTIGFDEFHFYGTVSEPVAGGTLARSNIRDYCVPKSTKTRSYLPNAKDSAAQPIKTVNRAQTVDNLINYWGKSIDLSDFCEAEDPKNPTAYDYICSVTSLKPRVKVGKPCTDLTAAGRGFLSAGAALRSSTVSEKVKKQVRERVYLQWDQLAKYRNSDYPLDLASLFADLEPGLLGSGVSLSSPSDVTSVGDGYDCGSPIEFIPVVTKDAPEPALLGNCVVPITKPMRVYKRSSTVSYALEDVERWISYSPWTPLKSAPPYEFAVINDDEVAPYNDNRYSAKSASMLSTSSMYDSTVATELRTPPLEAYKSGIISLVKADKAGFTRPLGADESATAHYFPKDAMVKGNFESFKINSNVVATAKKLRLDREGAGEYAAKKAVCDSFRIAGSFTDPLPPTETPEPTCTENCEPPCTVNCDEPEDQKPGGVTVRVSVAVAKSFFTAGLERPQQVSIDSVIPLCGDHVCGTLPSDASVETPYATLKLLPWGGYTECSDSRERGCGMLIVAPKPYSVGPVASQSVTSVFFSPTRETESTRIVLEDQRARVIPKKWIPPRTECYGSDENGNPTECVEIPGYWTPDPANAYYIYDFWLVASDGGSLYRPVIGTIGK